MAVAITRTADPAGVASSGGVTSYTSQSIGTAAVGRYVYVLVTAGTASDPTACTIGGVSATAGTLASFGSMRARLFSLRVDTGTTADIAVTWSSAVTSTQNHITVVSVTGHDATKDAGGTNTSTDMDASAPLTTGSKTIASGGGFLGVAACAVDTVGKTWANATEDLDEDAGAFRHTTASRTTSGTVTITCTGGNNNEDGALAYVVFKPGHEVAAGAGSFSFSGSTTTLNFKIGAGAGAYTFTGTGATLIVTGHPAIQATAGAFTFTGEDSHSDLALGPDAGAFTFTGSNAALTIVNPNISLSVDAGAFSFTGSDATLRRYTLNAGVGAFTFTGEDSKSDIGLNAGSGAFTYTGTAATLTTAFTGITADSGSFSFSGSNSGLTVASGNLRFIVDSGSFTYTGQTVSLSFHRVFADPASFTFTGEDSHSDLGVTVDAGSFSFTGQDAQITSTSGDLFIAADEGSFTFTGCDSLRGLILVLASGSFSFTGSDVALERGRRFDASPATAFTFTGSDVGLAQSGHRTLFAEAGAFTFTGSDVGVFTSTQKRIQIESGAFAFTGEDSHSDFGTTAGSGSFTFTGQNTTLAAGITFPVDSNNWAFAGSADVILTAPPPHAAAPPGGFEPGFWAEEHRKIKEREERVEEPTPPPIEALKEIPEFIGTVMAPCSEEDDIAEILELMDLIED